MNHKQLLALFLCFIILGSSWIIKAKNENIVSVKDVVNSNDNLHIETINEENDEYKIDVYYPVTDKAFVNEKVKTIVENEVYKAQVNKKNLKLSFEKLDYDNFKTIMLNVHRESDLAHDIEYIKSIVYDENKIYELKDIIQDNQVENVNKFVIDYIKNNNELSKIYNDKIINEKLKNIKNINFALTNNELILIFNPDELLPNVAGIIQLGIPYEILQINID